MIQPTRGNIVIERGAKQEKWGSIILPDTAHENPNVGTVVAIQNEVYWEHGTAFSPVAKVGDLVLIGKWSGVDFDYEDKKLVVLRQSEILAILEPAPVGHPLKEGAGAYA